MVMPGKGEIINKFYEYVKTAPLDKKLIEKYTLGELKQAKYHYKNDNSKLPDIAQALDDRIKELENRRERWIIGITSVTVGLVIAYLKGCFKLGAE